MEKDEVLLQIAAKIYRQTALPMAVWDRHGNLLASAPYPLEEKLPVFTENDYSPNELERGIFKEGWSFFSETEEEGTPFVVALCAELEKCSVIGPMAALLIAQSLKQEDRLNHLMVMKELVMEKTTAEEAKVHAQNIGIDLYQSRCVFLVETEEETDAEADAAAIDILRNLFPEGDQNFVFSPELHRILLILEIREEGKEARSEVLSTAQMIFDMLSAEASLKVHIAVGSIAASLDEVVPSYQEARNAMTVGKIFYPEKSIHESAYQGIGRMVYQMDENMCRQFLQENVRGIRVNQLDSSTLEMITAFFDNNLTLSETARQLYSHRNTLVYRLDKLQRQTGLDIRVFEDAFTFKLAMMVSKYLDSRS